MQTHAVLLFAAAMVVAGTQGTVTRVSVGSGGAQADGYSQSASVSASGRYVAFHSGATDLVAGDTSENMDVFVRDVKTGTTTRVSVRSDGGQADNASYRPAISANGRYIAFESYASNLAPNTDYHHPNAFVHDRKTGETELVSAAADGSGAGGKQVSISADGRYVAFQTLANLVPADTGWPDVYVWDRRSRTAKLASLANDGTPVNEVSLQPSISADGRLVAFATYGRLVPGDTNDGLDVYVRDLRTGTTSRMSIGAEVESWEPAISADGRYVAFQSNSGPGTPYSVFVRDRVRNRTELVGGDAEVSLGDAAISADGRYVTFQALEGGVFVRDRRTGNSWAPASAGYRPAISANGRVVAFDSTATDLVDDDTNGASDVFVYRHRRGPIATMANDSAGSASVESFVVTPGER
jgi:Tol biopolymer transport system component